jgi:hypothetical protein
MIWKKNYYVLLSLIGTEQLNDTHFTYMCEWIFLYNLPDVCNKTQSKQGAEEITWWGEWRGKKKLGVNGSLKFSLTPVT